MSNDILKQMSQRKQVKTALERITAMEEVLPKIISSTNNGFNEVLNRLDSLTDTVLALVELVGQDKVEATITQQAAAKRQAQEESAKENLAKALAGGAVKVVDSVTANTLIVGREYAKDTDPSKGARVQTPYNRCRPEHQQQLLGKTVGAVLDLGASMFEILEIYEIISQLPEQK